MSQIRVKKFGGTSVGSVERIQNVVRRVLRSRSSEPPPVLVVSAMAGETNRLVSLGEQIYPHFRGAAYDMLVASGEQVAVSLVAMALEKEGVRAKPYLAHQLGIRTDSVSSKARIQKIQTDCIYRDIERGFIPVVAGFQGVDEDLNITTLGRGGSDTTAVALAAALGVGDCEIFTDVPAVCTADPRRVPLAREIGKISFDEMMEMASLGSKVLHIRCVEIAAKHLVRIHLRSTFEDREGTWVVPEGEIMENPIVSAVTHDEGIAILELYPLPMGTHVLAQLFQALTAHSIVVDIITQSRQAEPGRQRLAFSVSTEDLPKAQIIVVDEFPGVCVNTVRDVAKVSVVGVGMRNHPGVAATFFKVLSQQDVTVHLTTTSEIKVSAVVDSKDLARSAQSLHRAFGLDRPEDSLP